MSEFDNQYFEKHQVLIGCDEVGRGPIAGPVNACAVMIHSENKKIFKKLLELGITDSKKLTTKKRLVILKELGIDITKIKIEQKYELRVEGLPFEFVIWENSPEDIDRINILQASLSCMKQAALKLLGSNINQETMVLVDGNKLFEVDEALKTSKLHLEAVVKGDSKSVAIALASIIAKEFRDELMGQMDKKFPGYGLAKHAGYPTKMHKEAVATLGVTPIHRKSFKGVKEFV